MRMGQRFAVRAGLLAIGLSAVLTGCTTRIASPMPEPIRQAAAVDATRLRARLDRDGDGLLDVELPMAPFPFNHTRLILHDFIEQQGDAITSLHARVTWETGTNVVIPASHPLDPLFQLLTGEPALQAHGLLVLQDGADAAGVPPVGDVRARAGRDVTAMAGAQVMLDGSASLGFVVSRRLSYRWTQIDGTAVELQGADTATASFVAPATPGTLVFTLTVSDGAEQDSDDVIITVESAAPLLPPDAARGRQAYVDHMCAVCHGENAAGNPPFPNLQGPDRLPALQQRFSAGRVHNGRTLSEQEIADVAAYLSTLP
ncbi:MAG TPA: c-type cytochrome [Phycisphaerae bacterium]